jgi:hypothetical protein
MEGTMSEVSSKFFRTDGAGNISLLKEHKDWRKTWHVILAGDFGGDQHADLLFYDRINGEAKFYTTDGKGNISLLRHYTDWKKTWDLIVPGNFGGGGHTGLLLYDRSRGEAKFFSTDGKGNLTLLKHHTDWKKTWDVIVPGNFGGSGYTDLLLYDRTKGEAKFFSTDGKGNLTLLKHHTDWKKTWDVIVPGNFGGDGSTDLLFYRRVAGEAKFFTTAGGAISLLKHHTGWPTTWDVIVPGNFGGDGHTDLLFYDRNAGAANFSKTDGQGNLSTLTTYGNWKKTWFSIIAGPFGDNPTGTDLLFYDNTLRLRIHAVKCSDADGTNAAQITAQQAHQWVAQANAIYSAAGIVFDFDPVADWEELKNTSINKLEAIDDNDPNALEKTQSKLAALVYATQYLGKVVVFFRHGYHNSMIPGPTGAGFSSYENNFAALPGFTVTRTDMYYQDGTTQLNQQNISLFAHELGHYLGIPHVFVKVSYDGFSDPHDAVVAYLVTKGATSMDALDGDRSTVNDTPPDVGKKYFLDNAWNPADLSREITITSAAYGINFTFNPDRHDIMSYFNCDDYHRVTPDQIRRIREWLHSDGRKHLIVGQV